MLPCFLSTGLCHVSNIPLVGSLSVKFHGKWDNLTFSRVSSRLAADVIIFLRIAGLLQHAVFLIPIPTYYLCYSFLFGGSAFGIVTRRMTLEKLL